MTQTMNTNKNKVIIDLDVTDRFPSIDIYDLLIFHFIDKIISSKLAHRMIDGEYEYYHVDYRFIIDCIKGKIGSRDRIYRRVRNLIDLGVIIAFAGNQRIGRTCFGKGPNYECMKGYVQTYNAAQDKSIAS